MVWKGTMTQGESEARRGRFGDYTQRHPKLLKLEVFLLALLGYAYILFFLGVAIALLLFHFYFWTISLPLLYVILRSLAVRIAPPRGIVLPSDAAPQLFRKMRWISRALHRPMFERAVVTEEFNAGVAQIPRLGLLGWQRNYLILGLPYLLALSPEQFDATLAHEFAHLFGAHSRFSGWIYRVRKTWEQLLQSLERRRVRGSSLFQRFFLWYSPNFAAAAFSLERANEREADAFALDWAGGKNCADCFVSGQVWGAFLRDQFWPQLFARVKTQPEPPHPYTEMREAFRVGLPPDQAENYLRDALAAPTSDDDPHPSLAERLAALGEAPHVPAPPTVSAAEYYLKDSLLKFIAQLNENWRQQNAKEWKAQYEFYQAARERVVTLRQKGQSESLPEEENWELAWKTENVEGSAAALPLYQALLANNPDHLPANYSAGRILLAGGNPEGIPLIEKAIQGDSQYVLGGCAEVYNFLFAHQGEREAQAFLKRHQKRIEQIERAKEERHIIQSTDLLRPHEFTEPDVARLREQLCRYPQVARAYLVRKLILHDPGKSLPLLGLVWRWWWPILRPKKIVQRLARESTIPVDELVFLSLAKRPLRQAFRDVAGAEIYRRPWLLEIRLLFGNWAERRQARPAELRTEQGGRLEPIQWSASGRAKPRSPKVP